MKNQSNCRISSKKVWWNLSARVLIRNYVASLKKTKYNLNYYLDLAKDLEDKGAHILCIKDMAGLLKPYSATLLIEELKK